MEALGEKRDRKDGEALREKRQKEIERKETESDRETLTEKFVRKRWRGIVRK